jgi:hypothetical protein
MCAVQVRVKTVQVAIQDPGFADSIRNLLSHDAKHQVHLVETPDLSVGGVIIVDAAHLNSFPTLLNEQKRLVVMVHKDRDDLSKIWDAGVRYVLFYGDTPQRVRVAVLGIELSLAANGASAG